MKLNLLTQQVREDLVADMGQELILAYIERKFPNLSMQEKSQLVRQLIAIPRKGRKPVTVEKPPVREIETADMQEMKLSARSIAGKGSEEGKRRIPGKASNSLKISHEKPSKNMGSKGGGKTT